jgi:hypothetical protein
MPLETRFLRLRQAARLGDRIDGWQVCWLGGWGRDRLFYVVMVVRANDQLDVAKVRFRCGE